MGRMENCEKNENPSFSAASSAAADSLPYAASMAESRSPLSMAAAAEEAEPGGGGGKAGEMRAKASGEVTSMGVLFM